MWNITRLKEIYLRWRYNRVIKEKQKLNNLESKLVFELENIEKLYKSYVGKYIIFDGQSVATQIFLYSLFSNKEYGIGKIVDLRKTFGNYYYKIDIYQLPDQQYSTMLSIPPEFIFKTYYLKIEDFNKINDKIIELNEKDYKDYRNSLNQLLTKFNQDCFSVYKLLIKNI